jgi:hypothetical protein
LRFDASSIALDVAWLDVDDAREFLHRLLVAPLVDQGLAGFTEHADCARAALADPMTSSAATTIS